jgi:hypothetical protein
MKGIAAAEKAGSLSGKKTNWRLVKQLGGSRLDGRSPMQLKDKVRNFTDADKKVLDEMRAKQEVPQDQIRAFKTPKRKVEAVESKTEEPASKKPREE